MHPIHAYGLLQTRRQFFGRSASGIGIAALAALLDENAVRADAPQGRPGTLHTLHHTPRAKRVIYLFMSGGPSHIDLFDYKPRLRQLHGTQLPASIRMGQRITGMTSSATAGAGCGSASCCRTRGPLRTTSAS
jgi:hypothetical protein